MKVLTAYNRHNLEELSELDETVVVYTNSKKIYDNIVKIRGDKTTHIIYDEGEKTVQEVILYYQNHFARNGVTSTEIYKLSERCSYVPYMIIIIILLMLFILTLSFGYYFLK